MTRTQRLQALWAKLNAEHFSGALDAVPIRITRSRRTYGYFNGPDNGGQPSIRISWKLARAEPHTLHDTMLHEMIHQDLHSVGHPGWDSHDERFQEMHQSITGALYVEPAK